MPILDGARARVALFRARDDADKSAAHLTALGFAVAALPVMEIVPIEASPPQLRYDAVIATSEKAFLAELPIDRAAPLYAVGAQTARAAEGRGWRLGAPPAPDSAALAASLAAATSPGAALLYLAGRDRKPAIEHVLSNRNALDVLEVYAAEARTAWTATEVGDLIASSAALHYSRRSASLANDLAEGAGASAAFRAMVHVCLSHDVAAPLLSLGVSAVRVALSPDEPALFQALIEAAAVFPLGRPSRI